MIHSLHTFLTEIVDYAGLFPPAKLPMDQAVNAFATYQEDPHRFMLARFVVPVARLPEFEVAAERLLPRGEGATPWRLSALVGDAAADDFYRILKFNERYSGVDESVGRAVIDVTEIRAPNVDVIADVMRILPQGILAFFEVAADPDPTPLITAIRTAGGRAKIRTGGITSDAFPPPEQVARFIRACRDQGVSFKATAGLHHPIRAEYRLTYDPNPPVGVMYGYLNIFGAALLAWSGAPDALIVKLLQETDIEALTFDESGFAYEGHTASIADIEQFRNSFAISFGSCSFREPVDDLAAFGLLK